MDDRNEFMKQFLTYGHVLTTEEIEAHAEEGVPENPPTLDMFKEQVLLFLIVCILDEFVHVVLRMLLYKRSTPTKMPNCITFFSLFDDPL